MYDKEFEKRIDIAIEKIGGVRKACEIIGISYPTLGRWKDGSSDPKLSNVKAFAAAAKVSLDWLVSGLEPSQTVNNIVVNEHRTTYEHNSSASESDYVYVPAYDIKVSAGHGMFSDGAIEPKKHLAFHKDWIKKKGLNPKWLAVLFNEGDSMAPTVPNQSAMVINMLEAKAVDGQVYVIRIDDRLYVKRIQWIPAGGLRLISDNKQYDSFDITKEDMQASDVEVCGQVIHTCYDLPN